MSVVGVRTAGTDIEMDISHIQAAYVIGGATVGIAIADADNADYTQGNAMKTTVFSLAMAF